MIISNQVMSELYGSKFYAKSIKYYESKIDNIDKTVQLITNKTYSE